MHREKQHGFGCAIMLLVALVLGAFLALMALEFSEPEPENRSGYSLPQ